MYMNYDLIWQYSHSGVRHDEKINNNNKYYINYNHSSAYTAMQSTCVSSYFSSTVTIEYLNNEHIGSRPFVLCNNINMEVVPLQKRR